MTLADDMLNEFVDFGGETITRGEVYNRIHDPKLADAWLIGHDRGKLRNRPPDRCTCGKLLDSQGEHGGGYGAHCG